MLEEIKENENKLEKMKSIGFGIIFFGVIVAVFYYGFFRTTNEIGYLGADKEGRQIFIQSLDYGLKPDVEVDSDFYDYNFIERVIQEPMRTTIRFDFKKSKTDSWLTSTDAFLAQPYDKMISNFTEGISTRADSKVSLVDIKKRLEEKNAKTIEDFLVGMGFKRVQIYENGNPKVTIELKGAKNTIWAGGE